MNSNIKNVETAILAVLLLSTFALQAAERKWTDQAAGIQLQELRKERTKLNIETIIAIGRDGPEAELLQNEVFAALSDTGPSDLADNYAKEILDSSSASLMLAYGALGYLLNSPQPWMTSYASRYIQVGKPQRLRAVACSLAARLGVPNTRDVALDVLSDQASGDWRVMALYCLAETMAPEALRDAVTGKGMPEFDVYNSMSYAGFRLADRSAKEEVFNSWLTSNLPILVQQGLFEMIKQNRTDLVKAAGMLLPGENLPNEEAKLSDKWRLRFRRAGFIVLNKTSVMEFKAIGISEY